eukprot:NODE_7_length_67686_cov_1.621421.p46 type:complete len:157 gc:universal NODE_7_length_67686_cov_1.621421:24453-24923(+)
MFDKFLINAFRRINCKVCTTNFNDSNLCFMWRSVVTLAIIVGSYFYIQTNQMAGKSTALIYSLKFEVSGKVQRVFFRKHTKEFADMVKLRGYVQNMPSGTVKGEAQGPLPDIEKLKEFLTTEGSPLSIIERLDSNIQEIPNFTYEGFKIIKRNKNG